jgi:formamidopyrimidine-DNA glycosylase
MPELPEVQTTVTQLARRIIGRTISSAWMDPVKYINVGSNRAWPAIRRHLPRTTITDVTRRAKYIVIHLNDGAKLWIHQKMTGHLLVKDQVRDQEEWKYIRMILTCTDGTEVGLSDARRFARVVLTRNDQEISQVKELASLGPEPLELKKVEFVKLFTAKRGLIKPTLMDATFLVGVGNIYADEILHRAHVHPFRPIQNLTDANLSSIYTHMQTILAKAIRLGGSSTHDYRTPDGSKGGYQHRHLAYQRTGQQCTICKKGVIERVFRNGRSSHFCSAHQLLS